MEPSPLESEASHEGVELLSGISDQVGPLAASPMDAAVVDVHGHPYLPSARLPARAGSDRGAAE
jgi:hypothetical protein